MIPLQIGKFKRYTKEPNAIDYGFLYINQFETPLPIEKNRQIRVYLPDDYFSKPDKKYAVMYMSDGQNMVDQYTTAYGEWNIDVRNHEMMEEGFEGLIYVGIDSPVDEYARMAEMIPSMMVLNNETYQLSKKYTICGEIYLDYIFNEIKPMIDQTFRTLASREHTLFGGSSMGGLIAFYAGFYRQDVVSKTLCFSPAFLLTKNNDLKKLVNELINRYGKNVKITLLSGGKDFEAELLKPTYQAYEYLVRKGFTNDQLHLTIDSNGIHNEIFWSEHFKSALKFLLES